MSHTESQRARAPVAEAVDLGIVDALVQSSFLVQEMLGELAAEHALSITQLRMLGVLRDREPRMAQLAQVLGLSRQSATGLVDRAQRRGLVRRATIPVGDERAVHVALTDAGRELAATVVARASVGIATLADGLSSGERERLSVLLSRLVGRHAEQHGVDLRAGAVDR